MRILTLDDMKMRQDTFKNWYHTISHDLAYTAQEAKDLLDTRLYDVVMLDHDLAEEHYLEFSEGTSEVWAPGQPVYSPGTGMDVVDHIVKMDDDRKPMMCIVHSWNSARAPEMVKRLRDAGVHTIRVPFSLMCPIILPTK